MTGFKAGLMNRRIRERSETLVLRAWMEGDPPHDLRVRITRIHAESASTTTITTTIEATCTFVENWLRELGANPEPPPRPVTSA
jgi:hypothetical protein